IKIRGRIRRGGGPRRGRPCRIPTSDLQSDHGGDGMTIARSVRLSKKGQFVIPKAMREAMGVKEGDEILVTLEEGKVVLTRPREYARATRGLLKGTWGKSRRAVERYIERERRSWQ